MTERLRFLLDTNILIPLQDSTVILESSLTNFVRLASIGGHQLLYHPATITDIERDENISRRNQTLSRLPLYTMLENIPSSPKNNAHTRPNDACDNDILYALECSAAHALITQDKEIHKKARQINLGHRVYSIQAAEDWLRRLHEPAEVHLPNIEDVPTYSLTNQLPHAFFDSLRENYNGFDAWFHAKAQTGRKAWVVRANESLIGAICIYNIEENAKINSAEEILAGRSLKLCTFKVDDVVRGRKIGELFLKAAFQYASDNHCENIFVHTREEQSNLLELLNDFGFQRRGNFENDFMLVKAHPLYPPNENIPALEYSKKYFPHYRKDASIQKFIIPIQPQFHNILFPDISQQGQLFNDQLVAGNAIKQAYLCKAQTNQIRPGDIVIFYRSTDKQAITTLGIVELCETHKDAVEIMQIVNRRTVYSQKNIEDMSHSAVKVLLFRQTYHFQQPIGLSKLIENKIIPAAPQSITKISDDSFSKILEITSQ